MILLRYLECVTTNTSGVPTVAIENLNSGMIFRVVFRYQKI